MSDVMYFKVKAFTNYNSLLLILLITIAPLLKTLNNALFKQ